MKRRAFKLLLFLLIIEGGAIINVAVAWGCALLVNAKNCSGAKTGIDRDRKVAIVRKDGFGTSTLNFARRRAFDENSFDSIQNGLSEPTSIVPLGLRALLYLDDQELTHLEARGLPLRSTWCRHLWDGKQYVAEGALQAHQNDGSIATYQRVLPYRPIWPGFAINTIFYAAIVWMLFAVPGAVRRRLRHKRGQCASCGYLLRECVSDKCPECGAAAQRAT